MHDEQQHVSKESRVERRTNWTSLTAYIFHRKQYGHLQVPECVVNRSLMPASEGVGWLNHAAAHDLFLAAPIRLCANVNFSGRRLNYSCVPLSSQNASKGNNNYCLYWPEEQMDEIGKLIDE